MKTTIHSISVCVLLLSSIVSYSQNISGQILFEGGKSQSFENIMRIKMSTERGATSGSNEPWKEGYIEAYYNNSKRTIPFEKLKKIHVYNVYERDWSNTFLTCSIEVTTTTDVSFKMMGADMGDFEVQILDELTGEKRAVKYNFLKDNARTIIFNN